MTKTNVVELKVDLAERDAISKKQKTWLERGMTTVEYSLGILCAAAIVFVVLRIINDNSFFRAMMDWILGMINQLVDIKFK